MDYISKIIKKQNCSIEELISCFEYVKRNGDIAVIKFDGERNENEYTIFISFPINKKREMIRVDGSDLKKALIEVLNKY